MPHHWSPCKRQGQGMPRTDHTTIWEKKNTFNSQEKTNPVNNSFWTSRMVRKQVSTIAVTVFTVILLLRALAN